ncbi:MAG: class I SAM-dependent methyltransferase [Planctomycetota bacterium]|nr:class I SAM-dependent methyltransferase [Planctomycetota bacterium]
MAYEQKKHAWEEPRVAREYDARRFRTPLQRLKHRRDEKLLLALLAGTPGVRRVLDLPCGTGRFLSALTAHGYRVAAADLSAPMIAASAVRRDAPAGFLGFLRADCERVPLRAGAVDAVLCMRFLFHVDSADARAAILREMGRVSAGVVIGEVRYRWTLKQGLRWLRSRVGLSARYRPSAGRGEIAAELAGAGLELRVLRPVSRVFSDKALFLARAGPRQKPRTRPRPPRRTRSGSRRETATQAGTQAPPPSF